MFQAILGPVAKLASTWIEGRQKKAELKSKVELTKLEATPIVTGKHIYSFL